MEPSRAVAYESKHVKCHFDLVQKVVEQHQLFFWEMLGTSTVVSKESHLESGGAFDSDSLYSVTTTERFSTVDFRRAKNLPGLVDTIKPLESSYFSLVGRLEELGSSCLDDYATPPAQDFSWGIFLLLCCLYVFPGVLYWRAKQRRYAQVCAQWSAWKSELDNLVSENRAVLNL
ncbi:MAG: hypothetical protein U0002_22410 [Thermoanaerobaculia bacterium]